MQLIDMVRTGRFAVHPDVEGTLENPKVNMISLARAAVPIEITNVVDWLKSDWYPHDKTLSCLHGEFRGIHPSFPVSWFEYSKGPGYGRRATCCVAEEDGGWIAILIDQTPSVFGQMPVVSHVGRIYFSEDSGQFTFSYNKNEPDGDESMRFLIANGAVPVLMAETLMCCRNVSVNTTRRQPKLVKKFTRKHGFPPCEFRTIIIDPIKAVIRSAACTGTTEAVARNRMHIIRGHFKTYTPERKLFGKVSGRFFFSAHVAGDLTLGVIQSEYVVKAGQAVGQPNTSGALAG